MQSRQLGILGESIAEKYLKKKGYQIIEKNHSDKFISGPLKGEVDIIAQKNSIINFIEVKTSSYNRPQKDLIFSPEERVNFQKQRKLIKLAQGWLMKNKIPLDVKWQIDIIGVKMNPTFKKAKIRHFPNAVFN